MTVSCSSFASTPARLPRNCVAKNFFDLAFLALLERFADANNRPQNFLVRRVHLAIHDLIRLAKQRAPLAVTEHDVADEQIAQHRRADLAGERAGAFPMHVLRADLDVLRLGDELAHFRDGGEWRHDHHLDLDRGRRSPAETWS